MNMKILNIKIILLNLNLNNYHLENGKHIINDISLNQWAIIKNDLEMKKKKNKINIKAKKSRINK